MKNRILLMTGVVIFLQSCDKTPNVNAVGFGAPKCNDKQVLDKAVERFKEDIKPIIIEEWVNQAIVEKESDLRDYAYTNGMDYDNLVIKERKKLEKQFKAKAEINLSPTKFVNIRTTLKDDEQKKCGCEAELSNNNLSKMDIYYTAQKVEDSKDLYIDVSYEVK